VRDRKATPKSGACHQSLLWNFYRRDSTPTSKKCSLFLAFSSIQSDTKMEKLRLFYIPVLPMAQTGRSNGKMKAHSSYVENVGEIVLLFWRTAAGFAAGMAATAKGIRPIF